MDSRENKYISSLKIPGSTEKRYIKDAESRAVIANLKDFAFTDNATGNYVPHGVVLDANIVVGKTSQTVSSNNITVEGHTLVISQNTFDCITDVTATHDGYSQVWGTQETVKVGNGSYAYNTVTFSSNKGEAIPVQYVKTNTVAVAPIIRPVTGFSFAGWYTDSVFTTPFDFSTIITSDIKLYAKWVGGGDYYTVKFVTHSSQTIPDQTVASGGYATRPTNPTRDGYVFLWWVDESEEIYNFNTPVYYDITLDSIWDEEEWHIKQRVKAALADLSAPYTIFKCVDRIVKAGIITQPSTLRDFLTKLKTPLAQVTNLESFLTYYCDIQPTRYTITFESNGGSAVASQTIVPGCVATEPTAPTKSGYTFEGWYQDSAFTTAYNFRSAVHENKTLYAKWGGSTDIRARVRAALQGINRNTCTFAEITTRIVNAGILEAPVLSTSDLLTRLGTPSTVTNMQEFLAYYLDYEDIKQRVIASIKDVDRTNGTLADIIYCLTRDSIITSEVTDLQSLKSALSTPDSVETVEDFLNYYTA